MLTVNELSKSRSKVCFSDNSNANNIIYLGNTIFRFGIQATAQNLAQMLLLCFNKNYEYQPLRTTKLSLCVI